MKLKETEVIKARQVIVEATKYFEQCKELQKDDSFIQLLAEEIKATPMDEMLEASAIFKVNGNEIAFEGIKTKAQVESLDLCSRVLVPLIGIKEVQDTLELSEMAGTLSETKKKEASALLKEAIELETAGKKASF